jgi:uncharacterized protein
LNIHKFELDGDYFIIDPSSGAVHIADAETFRVLDGLTRESLVENAQKSEIHAELYNLYKDGLLFSEDDSEFRKFAETSVTAPLKALCLHVSHDCNLRCRYCFAKDGTYGGNASTMTVETAVAALDFMVANSGGRVDLEADFFGGEPLMAWDTVTAAVKYARENESKWGKRFRFTITTNGLLLNDEKIRFINDEMSNCVLSLDGRKAVNDKARPTKNGTGSFDLVLDNFRKLTRSRTKPGFTDCYVRGTFTAYNLDFAEDIVEMSRLGFRDVSIEPVTVAVNADLPPPDYAIFPVHVPQIYEQYERLFRLVKSGEQDINFFHFNVDLSGGACVIRRLRGCGCGNDYMAVSPDGDVYPCHRFVGNDEWVMGNVRDGVVNVGVKEYFTKTHIYSKSDCAGCWARFYCSGGCNASSYDSHGDCRVTKSDSVECLMMKKRLECAIALGALKITGVLGALPQTPRVTGVLGALPQTPRAF